MKFQNSRNQFILALYMHLWNKMFIHILNIIILQVLELYISMKNKKK